MRHATFSMAVCTTAISCLLLAGGSGSAPAGENFGEPKQASFQKAPSGIQLAQATRGGRPDPKQLKGKPAPDFELDLLKGGTFKLSEEEGKSIVLLDFWATWCPPCRRAMPVLEEVAKKYHDKGVRYYAVDLRESPDKIKAYLKREKLDIAVPLDKDGAVAKTYQVRGIPTMFIVDKKGVIRDVHVGFGGNLQAQLEKSLDNILKEG